MRKRTRAISSLIFSWRSQQRLARLPKQDSGECGQIKLLKARESRQDEQQSQVQGQNISLSGDPDFWTSMDNHEGKTKTKQ